MREVSWTKSVPDTLGRAYFNVALGFALLALLIWAIVYSGADMGTGPLISWGLGFLVVITFIPRSIAGLVVLRRERLR